MCPFNTRKPLDDNPYAGTHIIRWENIDFPADGNYNIQLMLMILQKYSLAIVLVVVLWELVMG